MASSSRPCPSCGARVPASADRCDLCGHDMTADSEPTPSDPAPEPGAPERENASGAAASDAENPDRSAQEKSTEDEGANPDAVFCNACGSENPPTANFCSQCGANLGEVPDGTRRVDPRLPSGASAGDAEDASTKEEEEQQLMSQQLLLTIGAAILVVVALFFVSLWSQSQNWDSNGESGSPQAAAQAEGGPTGGPAAGGSAGGAAGGATTGPFGGQDMSTLLEENGVELSESIQVRVDSLEEQLSGVDGQVRRTIQEQLVNLYVGADAFGRAAQLQKDMSEVSGNAEDWRRTGDLFYNWMEYVGQESNGRNPAIAPIGRRAISAYEKVLESEPANHDVRTDMATVLLRSNDPMRGVEELNQVLDADSTFVPARFNKGIALLWIGRYDQAIEQFEAVKSLTGEGSPQFEQAARAIELVREEQNAQGSSSTSAQPPVSPAE